MNFSFGSKVSATQLRQLIVRSIVVLVLGGAQVFLWNGVRSSSEELQNARTKETQYQTLNERLGEINQDIKNKQVLFDQLSAVFPNKGLESQGVERLEQLADRRGVVLEVESITEKEVVNEEGDLRIIPFVVSVHARGSVVQLFDYIEAVEHVQEVTSISQWRLREVGGQGNDVARRASHELTMNVVFYLSDPREGGTDE